jgi:hypothetical protein
MVAHACNSGYSVDRDGGLRFEASLAKISVSPYLKQVESKGLEVWLK